MELEKKVINGLERISEVLKYLLWEKAKVHGISPIQIQILLFVSDHRLDLCNVTYLAKEFSVTKATISDAVRVLVKKGLLEKDYSPTDNRRYNLKITPESETIIQDLSGYTQPFLKQVENIGQDELSQLFGTISKLIYQLNQSGLIPVQRSCFKCKNYIGDRQSNHYCRLLQQELTINEVRLDCEDFILLEV